MRPQCSMVQSGICPGLTSIVHSENSQGKDGLDNKLQYVVLGFAQWLVSFPQCMHRECAVDCRLTLPYIRRSNSMSTGSSKGTAAQLHEHRKLKENRQMFADICNGIAIGGISKCLQQLIAIHNAVDIQQACSQNIMHASADQAMTEL